MSDDLKERLLHENSVYNGLSTFRKVLRNPCGPEAAQAITDLEAEVARLRAIENDMVSTLAAIRAETADPCVTPDAAHIYKLCGDSLQFRRQPLKERQPHD